MTHSWPLALAVIVAVAACDDDGIDPVTRITTPRVLAITAEPSALAVDGELVLTILTVDADGPRSGIAAHTPSDGRPVDAIRMRACAPWKFIADPARDCVGNDALPLPVDPTPHSLGGSAVTLGNPRRGTRPGGAGTIDGDGRAVASASALAAAFPSPPGVPAPPDPWRAALAAGLELRVPIIAEVDVDGRTLVARRDVSVVETTVQRQNPRIAEIRFDGVPTRTLRAGQRYTLTATFDPASFDRSPDAEPSDGLENVECNVYSPTGELTEPRVSVEDPDALVPETAANTYTAGPPGTTWMFIVATDETDGMSAVSVPLTIE